MCIIVILKLWSKLFKIHQLQLDDYLITGATIFGVVQGILSSVQVAAGLGKHMVDVSKNEKIELQKTTYAAQLLYVITLYLSRLAVFRFLRLLAAEQRRRRVVLLGTVSACVCGAVMAVILIFRCSPPKTWALFSNKCIDLVRFWEAEGIIGMLQDAFLAIVPVYLLHNVHLPWHKKAYVMGSFMVRLVTFPLIILRLVSIMNASTNDPVYSLFMPSLYTEIHMCISVIATCVPFLKPFTDSLQTGLLTSDLRTITAANSSYGNWVRMRALGKDTPHSSSQKKAYGKPKLRDDTLSTQRTTDIHSTPRDQIHGDNISRGTSEEGLVIQQTTTMTVETHSLKE